MTSGAIILAAGRGLRMGDAADGLPKCLLSLGPETILQYQLRALKWAGVERVAIVTGYRAESIREGVRLHAGANPRQVEFFHNPDFNTTNSLYSFYCAREFAAGGALVVNSDVVFHPALLRLLVDCAHENALLLDPRGGLGDEEMKVAVDGAGRVVRLGKNLPEDESAGENLGLVKFGPGAADEAFAILQERDADGFRNLWLPESINHLRGRRDFYALPIAGRPWTEIDFAEDLEFAREEIYAQCAPALET